MNVYQALKKVKAIEYKDKPFELRSGMNSHFYIHCDKLIDDREAMRAVMRPMVDIAEGLELSLIAGVPTGATPFVRALAYDTTYPYTTETGFDQGMGHHILILEDVVSTGNSVLNVVRKARGAGATVTDVVCIVHRSHYTDEGAFEKEDIKLHPLLVFNPLELFT